MRRFAASVQRGSRAITMTLPAPTGGWNARDSLSAMAPDDAITLDNWFPEADRVAVRPGFVAHATGVGAGAVETLGVWRGPGGSRLIAAGGGGLYNVTSAGGASAIPGSTAYNSDRWQTVNFKGRLFGVNGTDAPWHYDGATLSATAWNGSGLVAGNLIQIEAFKQRLFFAERETASFWYGGIGAVTGALTSFDLAQIARLGGNLQAIGTWSLDAGDGLDDLIVFVMSTGEIIIYTGTDPGDVSAWSKVGSYDAAPPIGRRCLTKLGGDLIVLTEAGYLPVSLIAQGWTLDRIIKGTSWGKIAPAVAASAAAASAYWGWQIAELFPNGKLYVNVPISAARFTQHVLNTHTGAWAKATGMEARSWAVFGSTGYFGGASGTVYKQVGRSDAGTPIVADAKTAFTNMGARGMRKRYSAARPVLSSEGNIDGVEIGCDTDFSQRRAVLTPTEIRNSGTSPWASPWGRPWGDRMKAARTRVSIAGIGESAALRLRVRTSGQTVNWHSTELTAELGGGK